MGKKQLEKMPVVSAGVDWLTVTCTEEKKARRLAMVTEALMLKEKRAGNDVSAWASYGYQGYKCGSIRAGRREDGWIVQASSDVAAREWRKLYTHSTNVSRLDLQVTVRSGVPVSDLIRQEHRRALADTRRSPRRRTVGLYDVSDGSSTLYIGKRVSDAFLRLYDKGVESKQAEYEQCARYEIEFKNDLARIAAADLASQADESSSIRARVSGEFAARGCNPLWEAVECDLLGRCRKATDDDRRLRWLREVCRGSVMTLVDNGKLAEVLSALGISELVRPAKRGRAATGH